MLIFILVPAAFLGFVAAGELSVVTTFMPETCSRKSAAGDKLTMHYTGTIDDSSATGVAGSQFDSSRTRNKPFQFTLGKGKVIAGWEQGLTDMCIGEKRELVIPPELGYGAKGSKGSIPGGATLKFDVECVDISDSAPSVQAETRNVFKEMDKDGDWLITHDELMEFHIRNFGSEKPPPPGMWERFDKNKDGIIEWEEFPGPKGTETPPPRSDKRKSKKEL